MQKVPEKKSFLTSLAHVVLLVVFSADFKCSTEAETHICTERPVRKTKDPCTRGKKNVFHFLMRPTAPKPASKPTTPRCSQLTQSCLPQDGCCDSWASCHCHFFNAICFCRRNTPLPVLGHYGQT
uniref:Agouti domain-containing protein n=1 Tax=Periophthalmus magnuspinnatus TaxID=409849 RepID=A0A3B4AE11_9GOBI